MGTYRYKSSLTPDGHIPALALTLTPQGSHLKGTNQYKQSHLIGTYGYKSSLTSDGHIPVQVLIPDGHIPLLALTPYGHIPALTLTLTPQGTHLKGRVLYMVPTTYTIMC